MIFLISRYPAHACASIHCGSVSSNSSRLFIAPRVAYGLRTSTQPPPTPPASRSSERLATSALADPEHRCAHRTALGCSGNPAGSADRELPPRPNYRIDGFRGPPVGAGLFHPVRAIQPLAIICGRDPGRAIRLGPLRLFHAERCFCIDRYSLSKPVADGLPTHVDVFHFRQPAAHLLYRPTRRTQRRKHPQNFRTAARARGKPHGMHPADSPIRWTI